MSNSQPSTYIEAVTMEDDRLAATLAAISADEDAGNLTFREAADNRVSAQELHLARCKELRVQYFGPYFGGADLDPGNA